MAKVWPNKDPDDILDYGFDWSPRGLGGDTITATTATVIAGTVSVLQHQVSAIDGVTTGQGTVTWLGGGVDGEECQIRLRSTTALGRRMDQTITMTIEQR